MSMSDHNPGECAAGECVLCLREENARLRAAVMDLLASAQPTEQEHPAMWSAWINARAAIAPKVKP